MPQNWKRIWRIIQSVLCALTAGALAAAAIRIYTEGAAVRATDLLYNIYTREKAGAYLSGIFPLASVTLVWALAGMLLGIKGEEAGKNPGIPAAVLQKAAAGNAGRQVIALRTVILILAVVLIVLGILNGGLEDVFAKGAAICTECVGLG